MRGKFTDRLIQVIFYTGILSTEISSSLEMLLPYQFSKGRERKREREKERERGRERGLHVKRRDGRGKISRCKLFVYLADLGEAKTRMP